MIEKLESAGLGFYVRATETQQKLGKCANANGCSLMRGTWSSITLFIAGKIPLRQLVYRVLDLPPSMRPLVYDFGQLTTRTEEDYTRQIVFDHVRVPVRNSHVITRCHHGMSCNTWLTLVID